jgi:hypothetical protein
VADHKFRLGQRVTLVGSALRHNAARGEYIISKRLPQQDGEFYYRIKSVSESHERVVRESELRRESRQ